MGGPARWTPEDRALVEAYAEWKSGLCPNCGTHADWWDEAKGGHRYAFIAEDFGCAGCNVREELQEQIPREARGVRVQLVPNPELMQRAETL